MKFTYDDLQKMQREAPIKNGVLTFDETTQQIRFLSITDNEKLREIRFTAPQPNLRYLDFGRCKIEKVVFSQDCEKLEAIYLERNQITVFKIEVDLPALTLLDLSMNEKLSNITLNTSLPNLKYLYLTSCNLTDLSMFSRHFTSEGFDFNIKENKNLQIPPPEIVSQGKGAVVNYFKEIEKQGVDYLYEAKLLIVGEPGAGKTTLFRKLKKTGAPMPEENETTRGIDIHKFSFPLNGQKKKEFTVNVWDFGGQEIYQATHQFFLTKRSLYVLLADARKEDTDFNYWLEVIELLSGKSPVIIVQNEKGGRRADFDERGLTGRFNNIRTPVHYLDLSKDFAGIENLRKDLSHHIQNLSHVGQELPAAWVSIREELENQAKKNPYINATDYYAICKKFGMTEQERALFLSSFLHDLGVFLHFQDDPVLRHWVILRNEWATNAVYAIMDDNEIKYTKKGHFNQSDIKRILKDNEYCTMHDTAIQLMVNFELCYRIPDTKSGDYIAPQLLPVEKPDYSWNETDNLKLQYKYDFMPKGLISRFMVRTHPYITKYDEMWRSGAVLHREKTQAEVIETYGRRSIEIRVSGLHKKELLTIVAENIDMLNRGFEGLKAEKLVPCNCKTCRMNKEPHFYLFSDLNRRREMNKRTVECPVSYEIVNVQGLLDDVFVTRSDVKSPLKVFISYSKKDKEYLERLKVFLSPLMREKNLIFWDDTSLIPGEDWDERIRYELFSADVIIFLISPDLLATDYIWKTEMKEALNRHESGEARMIPILIRPCLWESSPFARYNIIPEKGKPLSTYQDNDEGWKMISAELLKSIEWQYNMIR